MISTAAASTNPSLWTTLFIALTGAVVGGVLTAVTQMVVESRRAEHERHLDRARMDRQADLDEAKGRRESEAVASARFVAARVAAKLLIDDFETARGLLERFRIAGAMPAPPVQISVDVRAPREDRRLLAEHLTETQWTAVCSAERNGALIEQVRLSLRQNFALDQDDRENLVAQTIDLITHAITALNKFRQGAQRPTSADSTTALG